MDSLEGSPGTLTLLLSTHSSTVDSSMVLALSISFWQSEQYMPLKTGTLQMMHLDVDAIVPLGNIRFKLLLKGIYQPSIQLFNIVVYFVAFSHLYIRYHHLPHPRNRGTCLNIYPQVRTFPLTRLCEF